MSQLLKLELLSLLHDTARRMRDTAISTEGTANTQMLEIATQLEQEARELLHRPS